MGFFPCPILLGLEVLGTPSQGINPFRELKLPTECTLCIYSFRCNWLCPRLIQPVHLAGACMALRCPPLTPATLLAHLRLWQQEVQSAFLCLLDSFLPIFLLHSAKSDACQREKMLPLVGIFYIFLFLWLKKLYPQMTTAMR